MSVSDVMCLTLKGSMQTIMAEVSEGPTDFDYVMKNPVMVLLIPPRSASDVSSVGIVPFLNYTNEFKDGIKIHKSDIFCTTTPMRDLLNQYNQAFGSGLVVPGGLIS